MRVVSVLALVALTLATPPYRDAEEARQMIEEGSGLHLWEMMEQAMDGHILERCVCVLWSRGVRTLV